MPINNELRDEIKMEVDNFNKEIDELLAFVPTPIMDKIDELSSFWDTSHSKDVLDWIRGFYNESMNDSYERYLSAIRKIKETEMHFSTRSEKQYVE